MIFFANAGKFSQLRDCTLFRPDDQRQVRGSLSHYNMELWWRSLCSCEVSRLDRHVTYSTLTHVYICTYSHLPKYTVVAWLLTCIHLSYRTKINIEDHPFVAIGIVSNPHTSPPPPPANTVVMASFLSFFVYLGAIHCRGRASENLSRRSQIENSAWS